MKINKIYLKNINSFRGEHRIDFGSQPLSVAGLFAIVGPTGAGKSTLLDAITLALFNRIPRFEKSISKNLVGAAGMVLTRGERECAIEIDYTCKSGTYVSKWSISVNRNNNLNDYAMELASAKTGELLPLKKGEVPDRNEQLIGLSYDQFIKSILLSQGEFARFLKSNKNERGELLEDITGMKIYRLLGQKAFELYKEKGEVLEQNLKERAALAARLVTEDVRNEWQVRDEAMTDLLKKSEAQLALLNAQLERKGQIQAIKGELLKQTTALTEAQAKWQEFENTKAPGLRAHDRAEPFREEVNALENAQRELNKLRETLDQELQKRTATAAEWVKVSQQINSLCCEECEPENALTLLNGYREKVGQQQAALNLKTAQLRTFQTDIQRAIRTLEIAELQAFDSLQLTDDSLETLKKIAQNQKAQSDVQRLEAQLDESQVVQEVLIDLERRIPIFEALERQIDDYAAQRTYYYQESQSVQDLQKKLVEIGPKLETLGQEISQINQQIEQYEKDKEKASASFNFEKNRANLLKKDQPCPLCGSTEHPFLSHYANDYVEKDQLLIAQKKLLKDKELAGKELFARQTTALGLIEKSQKQSNFFNERMQIRLKEIDDSKKALGLENVGNKQWVSDQLFVLKSRKKALDTFIKIEVMVERMRELYVQVRKARQHQDDCLQSETALKKLYGGTDINQDCDRLQRAFTQHQTMIEQLNTRIKTHQLALEQQTPLIEAQRTMLEKSLQEAHFESIGQLKSNLLTPHEAQALRQEGQQLTNVVENLKILIQHRQAELEAKQKSDVPDDEDTLKTNKAALLTDTQAVRDEQLKLRVVLMEQANLTEAIDTLNHAIKAAEQNSLKWKLLNDYIGDREGKKFSTFAQGLTLIQLIAHANERLRALSDRYLLDKPAEGEEDELMVLDLYMGNERRSVKTLSGGETFLLSLSLALALSDLASRNVRLESLFIDEGFGTLDPDTLDVALSTLEKLQQEGQKNIGIISHVDAIKERISTQICLEKNSRGFSKIRIVA